MANRAAIFVLLSLLVVAGFFTQRISTRAAAPEISPGKGPVVVELFTSEGCSSCPPADSLLRDLESRGRVEGVEVIPLGWHVDYWDHQGWKDRFSSAGFTQRQQDYAAALGTDQVYTPQMVVDGRTEFVGSDANKARDAIVKASRLVKAAISLSLQAPSSGTLHLEAELGAVPGNRTADVLLLITERDLQSEVRAGENNGVTMKHGGVVRLLRSAGRLDTAKPQHLAADLPIQKSWKPQHLRAVLLLQDARDRSILGAASIPLPAFDGSR